MKSLDDEVTNSIEDVVELKAESVGLLPGDSADEEDEGAFSIVEEEVDCSQ